MPQLLLSKAAADDLHDIVMHTAVVFGVAQAKKTNETFRQTMISLAQSPDTGHERRDLDPAGKRFLYWTVLRRFLIVYQKTSQGIRVARILNGSREVQNVLIDDSGDD